MRRAMMTALMAMVMLLSLSITTVAGAASDPAAVKAAEELFEVIDMRTSYSRAVDMMVEQQIAANPQISIFRDTMKKFFFKYMGWDSVKGEMVDIYCKHFTAAEIGGGLGPLSLGLISDATGGFTPALLMLSVVCLTMVFLLRMLRPHM